MPSTRTTLTIAKAAKRVPGLRRVPLAKLLSVAEVAVLARDHVAALSPRERRRLASLLMAGRGRPNRLTRGEREELEDLVAKLEPRLFVGRAVDRLSPVPLPHRLVYGRRNRR